MSCPFQPEPLRDGLILLRRRPVTGGEVFDLQLVAVMLANDVKRVYTFNTSDFDAFTELTVQEPELK
jgi:hypothetical protein